MHRLIHASFSLFLLVICVSLARAEPINGGFDVERAVPDLDAWTVPYQLASPPTGMSGNPLTSSDDDSRTCAFTPFNSLVRVVGDSKLDTAIRGDFAVQDVRYDIRILHEPFPDALFAGSKDCNINIDTERCTFSAVVNYLRGLEVLDNIGEDGELSDLVHDSVNCGTCSGGDGVSNGSILAAARVVIAGADLRGPEVLDFSVEVYLGATFLGQRPGPTAAASEAGGALITSPGRSSTSLCCLSPDASLHLV